ncbi:urg3 [Seiridium cupressi]
MADPTSPEITHLLSLQAVRERSQLVLQAAKEGKLNSFDYDEPRMTDVANFVIDIIKRDFGPSRYAEIPPHGRWQHFNVGGVDRVGSLLQQWASEGHDKLEQTRRLIELFFVSVLVDAGVGDKWKFKEPGTDRVYSRSEGTAVASLYMFKAGTYNSKQLHSVDAVSLKGLTEEVFSKHFQITPENPMVGVASRVNLLNAVGQSLLDYSTQVFKDSRIGSLVDYLIENAREPNTLDYEDLWTILQGVLIPSWPKDRTHIAGTPIGDAWPLKVLADKAKKEGNNKETAGIIPFHKLTQWLGYSLTVPFARVLSFKVINDNLGTGLPEYRNGGLFYDLGALKLKPDTLKAGQQASGQDLPLYKATGDTIVEWRAMTVALLDELHKLVSAHFAKEEVKLSLAQVLEAGSWLGGRELAAKLRPETKSSPILFEGDGTLF